MRRKGSALDREDMGIGHKTMAKADWIGVVLILAFLLSLVVMTAFGLDLGGSAPIGLDPNGI